MKRIRGISIIEALVASVISIGAIAVTTFIYFSNMGTWAQGRGDIDSMASSQVIVKKVAKELQEAILVNVSPDGLRVDYQLPAKDVNGDFVSPAVSDNVARSFVVGGGTLIQITGPDNRTLATNLVLINPINGQIFVPFTGTETPSPAEFKSLSPPKRKASATTSERRASPRRFTCATFRGRKADEFEPP